MQKRIIYDFRAKAILDIRSDQDGGGGTASVHRLLADFFNAKSNDTAKRYWTSFRNFALFQSVERARWPSAIAALFDSDAATGRATLYAFKMWRVARFRGCYGSGAKSSGMDALFRCALERGIAKWSVPTSAQHRSELAWESCSVGFRAEVTAWLDALRNRNFAQGTLTTKLSVLRHYGRYLAQRGIDYLCATFEQVNDWLGQLRTRGWSDWYVRSHVESAKMFYRWLRRRRKILDDPFDDIGPMKVSYPIPDVLSEREALRLIKSVTDPRDRAVVELLYASGCRAREIENIDLDSVCFSDRTITCMGKPRSGRKLLFNEATEAALRRYLPVRARILRNKGRANEKALFVNTNGWRLDHNRIRAAVAAAGEAARLRKRVTPHVVRHTFATHLLNHGADPFTLMKLLGHKSLQATQVYLRVAVGQVTKIYRRCHPRK